MTERTLRILAGLVFVLSLSVACAPATTDWADRNEEGAFLMYRRQSLIGEETFTITADRDSIVVRSLQGENERGRVTGVQAELRLGVDLSPALYFNRQIADGDTTNILEVSFDATAIRLTLVAVEEPTVELWEVRQHGELFGLAFGGRALEVGARVEAAAG